MYDSTEIYLGPSNPGTTPDNPIIPELIWHPDQGIVEEILMVILQKTESLSLGGSDKEYNSICVK